MTATISLPAESLLIRVPDDAEGADERTRSMIDNILSGIHLPGTFGAAPRYIPEADMVVYLTEDCSFRNVRITSLISALIHPHEDRLVGVKLKGVRHWFDRLQAILGYREEAFIPLLNAINFAIFAILDDAPEADTLRRWGERLKAMLEEVERRERMMPVILLQDIPVGKTGKMT